MWIILCNANKNNVKCFSLFPEWFQTTPTTLLPGSWTTTPSLSMAISWNAAWNSFSPSDSKFVSCSDDGTLRIFDFLRCQEEKVLRGKRRRILEIIQHSHASTNLDCSLLGHGADVKCVHWHPQKALIVSGSKDNQQPIKLWDPKSGNALATL